MMQEAQINFRHSFCTVSTFDLLFQPTAKHVTHASQPSLAGTLEPCIALTV